MEESSRQFFAEVRRDPYAHMIAMMHASAWVDGYEQALRDVAEHVPEAADRILEFAHEKTFGDRRRDAFDRLAERQRLAEQQMLVALAQVGPLLHRTSP